MIVRSQYKEIAYSFNENSKRICTDGNGAIVGHYEADKREIVFGAYENEARAKEVYAGIWNAYIDGEKVFDMPKE